MNLNRSSFFNSSLATDGTEQNLFDITADGHFATWFFTHNMQAGDSVIIRVYVYDENAATMRTYETQILASLQSDPAIYTPFVPTKRWRVSIQRTASTDRAFTWIRIESS